MRGKDHVFEPEVDSLSFIDFENELLDNSQTGGRFLWHRQMVGHVVFEVTGGPANVAGGQKTLDLIGDTLVLSATGEDSPYDLNETLLWENVGRWARSNGFDTYNSDTRFELFPGNTPVLS